jgi:hypothetical protein
MHIRRVDWLFIVGALLLVAFVALLPSPRDRNPPVPNDSTHAMITREQDCRQCHTTEGVRPLPDRHPKRQDCFRCHRRES